MQPGYVLPVSFEMLVMQIFFTASLFFSEDSASSGDERKRFKSVISIAKSSKGRVEADFHEKSYQSRSRSRSRSISPRYS